MMYIPVFAALEHRVLQVIHRESRKHIDRFIDEHDEHRVIIGVWMRRLGSNISHNELE
jgi:hypothetical protein